ncbi:MAG: diadenylate cyclase [Christensenellaceae bacterium]|nr:diadenylate cyclase [Christensenellaceae bacterium]MDD6927470.1 DNA integrity scanning protein DisA nucleotide-binding domain protein [bacterium]MDY2851818.1 DNA integrity scanning protein DisA nucleotide-binding domain protein [Christensenellaceae bacterium]
MLEKIANAFSNFGLMIPEFILLFLTFFFVMYVLKENNAQLLNYLFCAFVVLTGIVFLFVDGLNNFLYIIFPLMYVLAMIIMFSTEIKRMIWNLSSMKAPDFKHSDTSKGRNSTKECINEMIKALQNMSKNDVGALIILASAQMPNSILESGVYIDSEISSALIESIFFPKTPLHDGAMVIKGTKIHSAGCFLPLSQEVNIPKDLGTRHRAGIGITETIDVTAIIVSEETGVISIANGGKIKRYADSEMLRQTLSRFYAQENQLSK